jgi:hypothetical protein
MPLSCEALLQDWKNHWDYIADIAIGEIKAYRFQDGLRYMSELIEIDKSLEAIINRCMTSIINE